MKDLMQNSLLSVKHNLGRLHLERLVDVEVRFAFLGERLTTRTSGGRTEEDQMNL